MEIDKRETISSAAKFFLERYAEDAGNKWYVPEEYMDKFDFMDLNPINNYEYYHDLSYEIFNSDDIYFFEDLLDDIYVPLVMSKRYIDQVKVFYAGDIKYSEIMRDLTDDYVIELELEIDNKILYRIRYKNINDVDGYIRRFFETIREDQFMDHYTDLDPY